MQSCASSQRQSLARGTNNHVFMENNNKYCCIGAQPGRAERGVQSGLYRPKNRFPCKEWDSIHRVLKHAVYAFHRYMNTDIIQHISCARFRVKFKTVEPSPLSTHKKSERYYNRLGFGINVYLRSHINRAFTLSIVQAHINKHGYQVDDRILCYFTFPIIGTAVALWPGDFLLFIPRRTLFLLAVNQETKYFVFLLTFIVYLLLTYGANTHAARSSDLVYLVTLNPFTLLLGPE